MSLTKHKILQENQTIQNLADAPSQTSLSAQQLKGKFDEFPELLRQKHNALIDELLTEYPDEEALRLMQARVGAYAGHSSLLAGEHQAGHVQVDGRTITVNEAGQIAATGATAEVASYEQAVGGLDNSSMMTPLRVKQALNQSKQGLNYALADACFLNGEFTALAWQRQNNLLALSVSVGAEHSLRIYSCDGASLQEMSRLTIAVAASTLRWSSNGESLAYLADNGKFGWASWDGVSLTAGQGGPDNARVIAWRADGRFSVLPTTPLNAIFIYGRSGQQLVMQRQMQSPSSEQVCAMACADNEATRVAMVTLSGSTYRLHMAEDLSARFASMFSVDLPAQPSHLQWDPAGRILALGYADLAEDVQLYARGSDDLWLKLGTLSGGGLGDKAYYGGFSWQGEGRYLAVSRAGAGPAYSLYAFNGAELMPLCESLWQGELSRTAFSPNGRWLASLGRVDGQCLLRVQSFQSELSERLLPQSADFAATLSGSYLLSSDSGPLTISCFKQPEPGQYFSFCGDYPARVQINGNGKTVIGAAKQGWGMYKVIYLAEQGGVWRVLPLSLETAATAAATAALDDSSALTPYSGGLLLRKRGRRAATIVVAAQDSLNAGAADFSCAGQSDQQVLQEAMAALPASGGELVLLDGTYVLDSNGVSASSGVYRLLSVDKPNVTISGRGRSTVLRLADNVAKTAGQQFCLLYGNAAGLTIRHLRCDGAKGSGNSAAKVTALALSLAAEQASLSNCLCQNCSEAGIASAAPYAHIQGNWLSGNLYGLFMQGGESLITNNDLYLNNYGLYATGGADMVMMNRIQNNSVCGVELRNCINGQVGMNTMIGNSSGIRMFGCSFIVVKENYIRRALGSTSYSASEYSLSVENCTDIMVVGNWLRGKEAIQGAGCSRIWASYGGTDWNPII